jgi:hypothetical protein
MRKNQVYGKSLAVIAILSVFIFGLTATSVANVPEGEIKKHDTSVKGDNAGSHLVGGLTIAGRQQLTGDEVGLPRGTKKGHRLKENKLKTKLKTKSKTKIKGATTDELHILDNKDKVHGSQAGIRNSKSSRPRK